MPSWAAVQHSAQQSTAEPQAGVATGGVLCHALGQGLPGLLPVGEAADMAVDVEVDMEVDMAVDVEVDAEAEEEKHPGVCPELNLGGVGGAASSHICWVAPKL